MQTKWKNVLVWFRRDLRVADQAALSAALRQSQQVHCLFVFDKAILEPLPRVDRRVEFIRESLVELDADLRALGQQQGVAGAGLIVAHGDAVGSVMDWARRLGVDAVFANHDDEPAAQRRDLAVAQELQDRRLTWRSFKDHVIFERSEVLTAASQPYSVFTPYKNAWLRKLAPSDFEAHAIPEGAGRLAALPGQAPSMPELEDLGFLPSGLHDLPLPTGANGASELLLDFLTRMDRYHETRDFPGRKGPSYLSTHLRFGTISIRQLVREALAHARAGSKGAEVWLSELIWRDFYHQILFHHPRVASHAFRPAYDRIQWLTGAEADARFTAWCEGRTGYPLVDAAMLQLAKTGYMHNRLRMVSASFLVKDLGLDWRRGEAWFALNLNDFDLAANNGGWQWAASTGCDAQPYFRIFNPISQSERFDPDGKFIRRYLPQLAALSTKSLHAPWTAGSIELSLAKLTLGIDYPLPIVDHDEARRLTLARFGAARSAEDTEAQPKSSMSPTDAVS